MMQIVQQLKTTALFMACALLAACAEPAITKHQFYVFGTVVEINIRHDNEDQTNAAITTITQRFNQMHYQWHAWKPGRLQQINHALRAGQIITLTAAEARFIQQTIELSQQSQHLFNPTIGALVNLWGFHTDDYPITTAPPPETAIMALTAQQLSVGNLFLNGLQLSSDQSNIWLDFGGIAKGYAIDQAFNVLASYGINHAIINAGGDLRILGNKARGEWQVAIQSPKDWQLLAEIKALSGEAIFTSGNYQRYKEFNGERYAHIIDPRTGYPVTSVVAATVIAANGILADAAATALVVAGDNWLDIAAQMGITQALIIDENHRCQATEMMLKRLENLTIDCQVMD